MRCTSLTFNGTCVLFLPVLLDAVPIQDFSCQRPRSESHPSIAFEVKANPFAPIADGGWEKADHRTLPEALSLVFCARVKRHVAQQHYAS
jgi:hypothetical protein